MTTASPVPPPSESLTVRSRNLAISILYALVLLVSQLLRLHQDKRCWMAVRILLATTGVLLVIQPLRFFTPWLPGIVGLALFLTAILLPPATPMTSVNDQARALGALVVLHGGEFQTDRGSRTTVRLFVGVDRICVLDQRHQTILTIPVAEDLSVAVAQTGDRWTSGISSSNHRTEFSYGGVFADHLARVAESTLRSVVPSSLPVIPRRRAAGV